MAANSVLSACVCVCKCVVVAYLVHESKCDVETEDIVGKQRRAPQMPIPGGILSAHVKSK